MTIDIENMPKKICLVVLYFLQVFFCLDIGFAKGDEIKFPSTTYCLPYAFPSEGRYGILKEEKTIKNLLPNPSFEHDQDNDGIPDGWELYVPAGHKVRCYGDIATHHGEGQRAIRLEIQTKGGADRGYLMSPSVGVVPETAYRFSIFYKTIQDPQGVTVRIIPMTEEGGYIGSRENWSVVRGDVDAKDWTELSLEFIPPKGVAKVQIELTGAVGTVWWDDVLLSPIQGGMSLFSQEGEKYNLEYGFDFGTQSSALMEGFKRVTQETLYTKELGYGWKQTVGLEGQEKSYKPYYEPRLSRYMPPEIYTSEISEDLVGARGQNHSTFCIDLPNGKYIVYLLSGQSGGFTPGIWDFKVFLNGRESDRIRIPGGYIWENRHYPVEIVNERLELGFDTELAWGINAIIVYPQKDEERVEEEVIGPIETGIYFLPEEMWAKAQEIPNMQKPKDRPELSSDDRKRGYLVFIRDYTKNVYPNTIPEKGEASNEIRTFATLGEYEAITFSVYAFGKDLRGVVVETEDLGSAEGAIIPKENLDLQVVRCLAQRVYGDNLRYTIEPDVLVRMKQIDIIRQGSTKQFWVTLKIPDDAKPGIYQGKLIFKPSNAPGHEVRVKLMVLPFKLRRSPDVLYGMYYRTDLPTHRWEDKEKMSSAYRQAVEEYLKAEIFDLKSHNIDVLTEHFDDYDSLKIEGDTVKCDFKYLKDDLEFRKEHGFNGPMPYTFEAVLLEISNHLTGKTLQKGPTDIGLPPKFYEMITNFVTEMKRFLDTEGKDKGWPEVLYYPIDESTDEEFTRKVYEAVKKVPGVRTYTTSLKSYTEKGIVGPEMDVFCMMYSNIGSPEKIENARKNNSKFEFWVYPNYALWGNHEGGDNACRARHSWGFYAWRIGVKGFMPWNYSHAQGNPFNDLDSRYEDTIAVFPGPYGPLPSLNWEGIREGIDDARYIYTLESLVKEAKASNIQELVAMAKDAEEILDRIKTSIPSQPYGEDAERWTRENATQNRWLIATKIMEIQSLLKRRQ